MKKWLIVGMFILVLIVIGIFFLVEKQEDVLRKSNLLLNEEVTQLDVYQDLNMIKDRNDELTIEDVTVGEFPNSFQPVETIEQKAGFFPTSNWLSFQVQNDSDKTEWILEFSFPLIYELQIFEETNGETVELYHTGAIFPFHNRPTNHRHFVFDLHIEPHTTTTYYVRAVGGGDLHPPINIWEPTSFLERNQQELLLLGLFYGIVLVMIIYNLFLYFSLQIRSYLYYVCVIFLTLMGKLSINGIGFQYIWPNQPDFNVVSTPFWVSTACMMIIIFTRSFLDLDRYLKHVKIVAYFLIALQFIVILLLYISHFAALTLMVISAFLTFVSVLTAAFISLKKGARQARFFIAGWLIFLSGIFITILERTVFLPYNVFTEYAGQAALTIEVVLLSFALADKINIMRKEKAEAELKASESQQLALANRKKADQLKDEFLAITSHELRTPLYGMIGIAESIEADVVGKATPALKNQMAMIISSGQRLTQLVNDILDLSVMNHEEIELEKKEVQLYGIIDNALFMCKASVRERPIKIENRVNQNLPLIEGDPNRIQQIFYNLLDNAIKYTNEGIIIISSEISKGEVSISITDPGIGIEASQMEDIFEPFKQGNSDPTREISGLGIGLHITKRLVEVHNGDLQVESELGKGSTFRVVFPTFKEKQIEELRTKMPVKQEVDPYFLMEPDYTLSIKKGTILVADDSVVNAQVILNHLSMEGFSMLHTAKGEEIFTLIEKHEVDLLIIDLMMTSISGYHISLRIREKYSLLELPIIMLTAKNQSQSKIASFESGANDYLVKPFDKPELVARVKTLVRMKKLNQELADLNQDLEKKVAERIKEINEVNHELKHTNQKLSQMAASRRDMLQNIAHELGTPVTLLHSYIQSVQEGLIALDNEKYHELITDKINVLRRLIQDLYDLALLESGKSSLALKRTSLQGWLSRVSQQVAFNIQQAQRKFEQLNTLGVASSYDLMVDEDRMNQVFLNLITNAVKYTNDKHGKIAMKVTIQTEQKRVKIEIRDNGIGIEKEMQSHIFERFYKDKSKHGSSNQESVGLGLAIVSEVIKAHKGTIEVESELNQGSSFFIILPLLDRDF